MNPEALFADHLQHLDTRLRQALAVCRTGDAVLIHSGSAHLHYADDQSKPFRAWGHFLRWLPVDRPDQFLLWRAGHKPLFLPCITQDFWHDQHLEMPAWWAAQMEITPIAGLDALQAALPPVAGLVFLGENSDLALSLGVRAERINPPALLHWLDYERAYKTPYEIARISEANAHALSGHQAAQDCFLAGGDEFDIHMAYLQACRVLEQELPYPTIVALDLHAATLHYQHKQRGQNKQRGQHKQRGSDKQREQNRHQVLLIDAGCRAFGYCSDITRTWSAPGVHPVFAQLLVGMQKLQTAVIQEIRIGMAFAELHQQAHLHLAQLLIDSGICRADPDRLVAAGVTQTFLPHGLGHLLGLQVHDVGGRLAGRDGSLRAPPEHYPALRNTRSIEQDMVFTIEPGLYFIPMLLQRLRASLSASRQTQGVMLDWSLVEQLAPLGGIRIEDNIWVMARGVHNLTRRPLLEG